MKFRKNDLFDAKNRKTMYGIRAQAIPGQWVNVCYAGVPCIYSTETERNNKIKELRKEFGTQNRFTIK